MSSHLRAYAEHYSALALLLTVGLLAIILFRNNIPVLQVIVWGLCGYYVLWGIVHHAIRKDLTLFIVLEYMLIGSIAGFVVSAVITLK